LVVGIIAILAGVFAVATGRGGELAYEHADHAPLDLGPVSATDVALLRPPTALWGYNMQVTDEALDRIARALRDRDIEIAYLQRQLGDLGQLNRGADEGTQAGQLHDEKKPDEKAADEKMPDEEAADGEPAPSARTFVPKHERPRAKAAPAPATEPAPVTEEPPGPARDSEPASESSQSVSSQAGSDDDAVAAAEEQGW
jgi:hypothetical protein